MELLDVVRCSALKCKWEDVEDVEKNDSVCNRVTGVVITVLRTVMIGFQFSLYHKFTSAVSRTLTNNRRVRLGRTENYFDKTKIYSFLSLKRLNTFFNTLSYRLRWSRHSMAWLPTRRWFPLWQHGDVFLPPSASPGRRLSTKMSGRWPVEWTAAQVFGWDCEN